MQMMYETIYKALEEVGLEGSFSAQDYLNFFCLGNREASGPDDNLGDESPSTGNTPQVPFDSLTFSRISNLLSFICKLQDYTFISSYLQHYNLKNLTNCNNVIQIQCSF